MPKGISKHNQSGWKHTEDAKRRIALLQKGEPRLMIRAEKHGQWKGDEVGYSALHAWIKRQLIKPQCCRNCNQPKKLDLANISGEYKRDLSDWEWLCRSCHMIKDGRLEKMRESRKTSMSGKKFTEEHKQKIRLALIGNQNALKKI